ncbi:VOC family protein [Chondrinema litorale]|mgnify:CR=1 FL=1|uniref:VOC family protein n=1 Tax=Chondrinema litorale TaxID=2994555 RepID=UPI000C434F3F|nr:VOC family protein [Chondrinema litorale]MBT29244.1 extradiol dioxygenase [Thalassovita sp.]UZR97850.1 VOC family protein [Chondrinema litorale]
MASSYKPEGYNSISPYFVVENAQLMINFLDQIFNIDELRRYENAEGKIVHAEVKIDDSVIMLADANEQFPPNQLLIHVYVADVDATFKKAIAAGCIELGKPQSREGDPDKRGSFKDIFGNFWSVSTQMG